MSNFPYPNIEFDSAIAKYDWDHTYDILYLAPHYPQGFETLLTDLHLPIWGAFDRFSFNSLPYAVDYSEKLTLLLKNYAMCPHNSILERQRLPYCNPQQLFGNIAFSGSNNIPSFVSGLSNKYDKNTSKIITIPAGYVAISWLCHDTDSLQNGKEQCPTFNKATKFFNSQTTQQIDLNQLFKDTQQEDFEENIFIVNSLCISVLNSENQWVNYLPSEITEPYYLYFDIDNYFAYLQNELDNYFDFIYQNFWQEAWSDNWLDNQGNSLSEYTFSLPIGSIVPRIFQIVFPRYCNPKGTYLKSIEFPVTITLKAQGKIQKPIFIFEQYPDYFKQTLLRFAKNKTHDSDLLKADIYQYPMPSNEHDFILNNSSLFGTVNNTSQFFNYPMLSQLEYDLFTFENTNDYPLNTLVIDQSTGQTAQQLIAPTQYKVRFANDDYLFGKDNGGYYPEIIKLACWVQPSTDAFISVFDENDNFIQEEQTRTHEYFFIPPFIDNGITGSFLDQWIFPFIKNITTKTHTESINVTSTALKNSQGQTGQGAFYRRCDYIFNIDRTYAQGNLTTINTSVDRYYLESRVLPSGTESSFNYQAQATGTEINRTIGEIRNIKIEFNLLSELEFTQIQSYGQITEEDYILDLIPIINNLENTMVDSFRTKQVYEWIKKMQNLLGVHDYADLETPLNANLARKIDANCKVWGIQLNNDSTPQTIQGTRFFKDGETLPLGWYPNQITITTGWNQNSRVPNPIDLETMTIEDQKVGLLYDVISNRIETDDLTGEQRIVNGGYIACNSMPQYLRAMLDDIDKMLGGQYLGAGFINRGNTTFVYEGLANLLHEMFAKLHKSEGQIAETHLASGITQQMIKEILRGLGLPVATKAFSYQVQTSSTQEEQIDPLNATVGNIPVHYSGYAEGTPTLVDILISILAQEALQNASEFTLKQEQQNNLRNEVNK